MFTPRLIRESYWIQPTHKRHEASHTARSLDKYLLHCLVGLRHTSLYFVTSENFVAPQAIIAMLRGDFIWGPTATTFDRPPKDITKRTEIREFVRLRLLPSTSSKLIPKLPCSPCLATATSYAEINYSTKGLTRVVMFSCSSHAHRKRSPPFPGTLPGLPRVQGSHCAA